ncbi:MAG: hypothetical protein AAGI68_12125 [Planctomycetota bacterium]
MTDKPNDDKAKAEAEAKAQAEAEAAAKAELEAQAKAQAEARAKAEALVKAKALVLKHADTINGKRFDEGTVVGHLKSGKPVPSEKSITVGHLAARIRRGLVVPYQAPAPTTAPA